MKCYTKFLRTSNLCWDVTHLNIWTCIVLVNASSRVTKIITKRDSDMGSIFTHLRIYQAVRNFHAKLSLIFRTIFKVTTIYNNMYHYSIIIIQLSSSSLKDQGIWIPFFYSRFNFFPLVKWCSLSFMHDILSCMPTYYLII